MKILHLTTTTRGGGAIIACVNLHKEMLRLGYDSYLFSIDNNGNVSNVYIKENNFITRIFNFCHSIFSKTLIALSSKDISKLDLYGFQLNLFSTPILKVLNKINPDIIHLHYVSPSLINFTQINKIVKPIFWTLHDYFPFTGGCQLPLDCHNFQSGCTSCNVFNYKFNYLTKLLFKHKISVIINKRISFISPSKIVFNSVNSINKLVNNNNIIIPNVISKIELKSNVPRIYINKTLLFISGNSINNWNKNFSELVTILNDLVKLNNNFNLLIISNDSKIDSSNFEFKFKHVKNFENKELLFEVYSSSYLTLVPSHFETFSNVSAESVLSGTPVVVLNQIGAIDFINSNNGFSCLGNKNLFVENLHKILNYSLEEYSNFRKSTKLVSSKLLDSKNIVESHIEYYKNVISK